jgi:glycosyltransferase involved in cell wall biosynthesis
MAIPMLFPTASESATKPMSKPCNDSDRGAMMRFDYFVTGPRMGLRVPIALEQAGLLESLHLDAWLRRGGLERLARGRIWGQWNQRVTGRVISQIPARKIHAHPQIFVLARARRRLISAGRGTATADRLLLRTFAAIARECKSAAVFGLNGSSLELFRGRDCRIMEQCAPPFPAERKVAADELRNFEGWAVEDRTTDQRWRELRMHREWEQADVIWAPSARVVELCREYGANPAKLRVLRYPIPQYEGFSWLNLPREGSALRVVFAGTLMLEKGVQYIYEALHQSEMASHVDMHFFGPIQLSPEGVTRLSDVGTVHGPVSRARLLHEFTQANVLLFPSLSEGSALVTAEAAGVGLPMIATREAGPPDSALVVEARSGAAIRGALERVLDDPSLLGSLSQACLAEARRRNVEAFNAELASLAREALATCL